MSITSGAAGKEFNPGIVFDLDGTLIDSCPGIGASLSEAFASAGRMMPAMDLRAVIGPPIRVIAARIDPTLTEEELAKIELTFRAIYDNDGWRETVLYGGVEDTLRALHRRGVRMFIVTNKPKIPTAKVLDYLGLTFLFDKVVTRDSRTPTYGSKTEMLAELMQQQLIGFQPSIMMGDTREDEEAAVANGLSFFHAAYGYGTAVAPHCTVLDFSELSSHFAKQ